MSQGFAQFLDLYINHVGLWFLYYFLITNTNSFIVKLAFVALILTIPIYTKVSFGAGGSLMMVFMKALDIAAMPSEDTTKWTFREYLMVWWATETKDMRTKQIVKHSYALAGDPQNYTAERYLSRTFHSLHQDPMFYFKFICECAVKFVILISIPRYLERVYPHWNPTPWKFLDLFNLELVALYYVSAVTVYSAIFLGHAAFALAISLVFDIPALRCYDEPFSATSLRDFWGNRWNLNTQFCIRRLSYDKVMQYGKFLPRQAQLIIGNMAAFIVSGLMHEWLLWSLEKESHTFEQLGFFVLHGLLLTLETLILKFVKSRYGVDLLKVTPKIVLNIYTHLVLLYTSPLMLNPYIRLNALRTVVYK